MTTIELMPVHAFLDDRHLVDRGLRNYWGYNTIGFFAPDARYSASGKVNEFKTMVKTLHSAGLEVILDVVYNHTAEGNHLGPTLCFRGIDNAAYYRLTSENGRYYMDYTGCGNTLDMQHPRVLQLMMDWLRYWVTEMHVDGFRFDLASALARELHEVDRLGAFFDIIRQDPVLNGVKLIAEPWDLGEGGYQVGNFPVGWAEWNDKYRDAMRAYWKGDGGLIGEFAQRLTGSSDLYGGSGRRPHASINFVTAHDGFTLHDLVSYNEKHNEANGEDNRDGHDNNLSWNCGVEGGTDDPAIRALRERQKRNLLATLLLSQGVPMLLAGDELGRTQRGNNNAYCQDNEVSWVDWALDDDRAQLLEFVRRIIALRRDHPVFRRRDFFEGRPLHGSEVKDIAWLKPDGTEMTDEEWSHDFARSLGVYLAGEALPETDERGRPVRDDNFLLLFNAHHEAMQFTLPDCRGAARWRALVDTAAADGLAPDGTYDAGAAYPLRERAFALLVREPVGCIAVTGRRHVAARIGCGCTRSRRADGQATTDMPFGAATGADGSTRFRLWAPAASCVELVLSGAAGPGGSRDGPRAKDGWFELTVPDIGAGARYAYRIDGGLARARSRVALQSGRRARGEHGRRSARLRCGTTAIGAAAPGHEAVIYELHVGTFTAAGTFAGVRRAARRSRRARRHRHRTDAGRRLSRATQLGLRRRAAVRARCHATARRRT